MVYVRFDDGNTVRLMQRTVEIRLELHPEMRDNEEMLDAVDDLDLILTAFLRMDIADRDIHALVDRRLVAAREQMAASQSSEH
jgi:hypothetical protein